MKEHDPHKPVLVIGYGNTLRGDDGLGPHVASLLSKKVDPARVHILAPQQLTPDLAERVAKSHITVLIDARVGDHPGQLHHTQVCAPTFAVPTFQHHVTPEVLLGITSALYHCTPAMHLFSVEAETFEIGARLSPAVEHAAQDIVEHILKLL